MGVAPTEWSNEGIELYCDFGVFVNYTYATLNTYAVSNGYISLRARAFEDGIQTAEEIIVIYVSHRSILVSKDGSGQYSTIQAGIEGAEPGDTVHVAGPADYAENVALREFVYLAARDPGVVIVGVGDNPVVTIEDQCNPSFIQGFTIKHQNGEADTNGRGIYIMKASAVIRDCIIKDNKAHGAPGISINDDSYVLVERCTIENNVAEGDYIFGYNAGPSAIGVYGYTITTVVLPAYPVVKFIDCDIINNDFGTIGIIAPQPQPAVTIDYYSLGTGHTQPRFENCRIVGNYAHGVASAILFKDCYKPELINCVITDNMLENDVSSENGAAIYCFASGLYVENCTIANNKHQYPSKLSGIRYTADACPGGCTREITHSILAFNEGPAIGGGSWVESTTNMIESVVFGNLNPSGAYGPVDSAWVSLGVNVVVEDPAFCDMENGDYTLYAFSPCMGGVYVTETIGVYDVGCVPDADVTVLTEPLQGADLVYTACPKGDALPNYHVTVEFPESVLTRGITAQELTLDFSDSPFAVFDEDGVVNASYPADSASSYTTIISHGSFGGYGTDSLNVLLNGTGLEERAFINLRSFDENADGTVNIVDLSLFSQYYPSPPEPYVSYRDYNADSSVNIIDHAIFSMHYGHETIYPPVQGVSPSPPQQTDFDVRLDFTEEVISPLERELRVDVNLENITQFKVMCVSLKHENERLVFKQWSANENYAKPILLSQVERDGVNQLFFGVVGSKSYVGNTLYLGTLVLDVVDGQEANLTEEDFELIVGDVLLTGGQLGVIAGVSANNNINRVYHNHLAQNYPNPFNPTTTIAYSIKKDVLVKLAIYDVKGALVRTLVDERQRRNAYRIIWDGKNDRGNSAASGVYFYRVLAGDFKATKKMVLLR